MRILIINPIPYTSETRHIQRAVSIKDTMIYDLCLAFQKEGHYVTLFAAEPYKPVEEEEYPFQVVWGKCLFQRICMPHRFPYMPSLRKHIKEADYDLIISGEVFSSSSLIAYRLQPDKTIIWHEIAKHNNMLHKIPSKIWYNFLARVFMKNALVVGRSSEAKDFIGKYCKNTSAIVIDHGVNLDLFSPQAEKENTFVVCSQLIPRKRIDGILEKFASYVQKYDNSTKLLIIGSGESEELLINKTLDLHIEKFVKFMGKMTHEQMIPYLAKSQALLVNTEKDNSMISIVESIALGTPVLTTEVPLNASYIKEHGLGIAKNFWNCDDMRTIVNNLDTYVDNCIQYREVLSTRYKVKQFMEVHSMRSN